MRWLGSFVDRYQCVAAACQLDGSVDGAAVDALLAKVPEDLPPVECLLLRALLESLVLRHPVASGLYRSLPALTRKAIVTAFRLALFAGPGTRASDERVQSAISYIRSNYQNSGLSLEIVAAHVSLSSCYLSSLIKRVTGRGFSAHLSEARMNAARALLLDRHLSVKEVAVRVGFSNTDTFDRQFKRSYGLLPNVYRLSKRA